LSIITVSRQSVRWLPAPLAGLCWLWRYAHDAGLTGKPMWDGWFDQSRYVFSARAFAHLDLGAGQHWYPPAYALLAAPFTALTPDRPFLIPDLLLYALTALAFVRVAQALGIGRWIATAAFILATLAPDPAAQLWIEPWTTTLSAALIWGLLAVIVMLFDSENAPPAGLLIAAGALAAAPPLVRPADGLVGIGALAVAAIVAARRELLTSRRIGLALLGGAIVALPYAALYLAIYGAKPSDYIRAGANQGFAVADLPWKAYTLLVSPRPWFPGEHSMVETLPFLLPGTAGLIALAAIGAPAQRRVLALIAAVALPFVAIQLAYTDFQPPGLWRYQNAHYLKWLFPLAGAGVWIWLRSFGVWRHWRAAMAATIALLLLACIRPLPVAAGETQPTRMLRFHGFLLRDWSEAYFAPAIIRDDAGTLANVASFHQVPDQSGERAIAVKRLFAAHPLRRDPGEPPPYDTWQKPYARYTVRLSFGWPCWFDRPECQLPP
jgi:hypothetical protein